MGSSRQGHPERIKKNSAFNTSRAQVGLHPRLLGAGSKGKINANSGSDKSQGSRVPHTLTDRPRFTASRIARSLCKLRRIRPHEAGQPISGRALTADVLRELMPLFAVVRAKRRPLVITCLSALQDLSYFPLIGESNSPKGYSFLELPPNHSELSPVHGRLLPLCFKYGKPQARAAKFRRRSTAANHDLAAGEKP